LSAAAVQVKTTDSSEPILPGEILAKKAVDRVQEAKARSYEGPQGQAG
jgi:hypothetical protein